METAIVVDLATARTARRVQAFTGPLSREEADALRDYWTSFEAAVGHHSAHGPMVDRMCGFTRGGPAGVLPSEQLACWSNKLGMRMAAVASALRRMPRDHVQILYRTFGPRDPNARVDLLGPTAALAEYTPIVEAKHREMVEARIGERIHAARDAEERRLAMAPSVIAASTARIEHAQQEIIRLRELRGERGWRDGEREEQIRWRSEVHGAERRIEDVSRPLLEPEAWSRAEEGIRISTRREITTADALEALLSIRVASIHGDARGAFAKRERAARLARDQAARRVAEECNELLAAATASYVLSERQA